MVKSDRAESAGYGSPKGSSASSKGYGSKSSGGHKGMNWPEVAAAVQKASLRPERPQSKPQFMNDVQRQRQREEFQEQRRELSKPSPDWTGPKRNVPIGQSYGVRGRSRGPQQLGMAGQTPDEAAREIMGGKIAKAKEAMRKGPPVPTPRPSRESPKSPGLLGKPIDQPQRMTPPPSAAGRIPDHIKDALREMRREMEGPRQNRGRFSAQPPPAKSVPERQASGRSRSGYRGGRDV